MFQALFCLLYVYLKAIRFIGRITTIGKAAKKFNLSGESLFSFGRFSIGRHGNVLAKVQNHVLIFLMALTDLLPFICQYIFLLRISFGLLFVQFRYLFLLKAVLNFAYIF
jgi:hypothetical protein